MSDHRVIVPVKGLKESKTRLSSFLSKEKREALVKALLEDVLTSLQASEVFTNIAVVSPDQSVSEAIQSNHVDFVRQTGTGLNAAVQQAISTATKSRADSLTIALADVPMAESRDFVEFFRLGGNQTKVVLAPSLKGGTNVMTLHPPNAVLPGYGRWSYAKHLREAQRRNLNVYSVSNNRLSFDIDTTKDLTDLRRLDPTGKTKAGKIALDIIKMPAVQIKH